MSRFVNILTHGLKWRLHPQVLINSVSCPQRSITIRLPKADYDIGEVVRDTEVIATFYIGSSISGSPTSVVRELGLSRNDIPGILLHYKEGNNDWLLSRELCLLNNKVVFINLPTQGQITSVMGVNLLECSSRMAKQLKEKLLPSIVSYGRDIKITNTDRFTINIAEAPSKIVTPEELAQIVIDNIDQEL